MRAAEAFTRVYYKTYDSPTRAQDLPAFYRPSSAVAWNGHPYPGVDGLRALIEAMPRTRHEVQSYDCHPIPSAFTLFPIFDVH
jgi:NTF2-related export protein 1/2